MNTHADKKNDRGNLGIAHRKAHSTLNDAQPETVVQAVEIHTNKSGSGMPENLKQGLQSMQAKQSPAQSHVIQNRQRQQSEPWGTVQRRQNAGTDTQKPQGVPINDDAGLEKEADDMGHKAVQMQSISDAKPANLPTPTPTAQAPIQRAGGKDDEDGGGKEVAKGGEGDKQLVSQRNMETNINLLARVFHLLPPDVQDFLLGAYEEATGQKIEKIPRVKGKPKKDDDSLVLVSHAKGPESDNPMMRILGLDPKIIGNVVKGLFFMPKEQQQQLSGMKLPALYNLFQQLATAKYSSVLQLDAPESGALGDHSGAEHIQNSCYAASLLNIIAVNPAYLSLFNPLVNHTAEDSPARELQDAIYPLARIIRQGGTVNADRMRELLDTLNTHHLLMDGGGGEVVEQQQDASQVLMGILNIVRPAQPLTTRETRVYDDHSPNQVSNENEFVLQLYAHGRQTFEEALSAHFVNNVHVTHGDDNVALHDPHRVTRVITSFPDILTIGMVRAGEFDSIDMPRQFTVPQTITHNGQPGPTYRLTAFVVRNTISHLSGGHYVAVMEDNGAWYESDDMGASKEGEPGVMTPETRQIDPDTHYIGDHHAPAYAMATLYTYQRVAPEDVEQGGNRIGFRSNWMLRHPALADLLLHSSLSEDKLKEREKIVDEFLKKGGNIWDAFEFMTDYPDDNTTLKSKFEERSRTAPSVEYTDKDTSDPIVQNLLKGFSSYSVSELLKQQTENEKLLKGEHADFIKKQLIAIDLALKAAKSKAQGGYKMIFSGRNEAGMSIEFFATEHAEKRGLKKLSEWVLGVQQGLMNARFLQMHMPPPQIRIYLRPEVTDDIACTRGSGNIIRVEMDDYQPFDFTVGESLGLLAHELGVHSLDNTTLTKEQMDAETKDKAKKQKGKVAGYDLEVGLDPKLKKQQTDHLTIARGVLGDVNAAPRLNMYEATMISILTAAVGKETKKEIAAAYCIDIARILTLNDDPTEMSNAGTFTQIAMANKLANVAVAEWVRIQSKYKGKFKAVAEIKISYLDIVGYLNRLRTVLAKVREATKGKKK